MNDTLKAAGRIGAELGAAKAEVDKLRAILEGILFCGRGTSGRIILDAEDEDRIRGALMQAGPERICPCQFGNCLGAEDDEVCKAKQAEPTDTYTAVDMATAAAQGFRDGQAAVEQAAAKDEREAPIVVATAILGGLFHGGSGPELGEIDIEVCTPALETIQCETVNSSDDVFLPLMTVAQHERIVASLTRPAQTEQQSVAVVPEEWKAGFKLHEIHKALDCGLPAPSYWAETCDGEPHVHTKLWSGLPGCGSFHSSRFWPLYGVSMLAFPIAQTAPQLEQSGLVLMPKEATPEIVAAMKRELDKAPTWYCRYSAAYRAALSAQGAGDADS